MEHTHTGTHKTNTRMHTGHSASGGGRRNTRIRVHTKQTHTCMHTSHSASGGGRQNTHIRVHTNKHTCIQVTVRVEVDVGTASGLGTYLPGDTLGIFAPNASEVRLSMHLSECEFGDVFKHLSI